MGKALRSNTRQVSAERMRRFIQSIDAQHFWDEPPPTPELVADGGYYAIEGVKNGRYQLISDFYLSSKIAKIGKIIEQLQK